MQSQTTASGVIEQEKRLVRELANLADKDEVVFNDAGWDSRVYSINNGPYFFKFPRSDKIKQRYEYELAALKLAAEIDPRIKVPKVIWRHPANDYFGYEGVPGTALTDLARTLDAAAKQTIGETIGEFLKRFHQAELPGARDMTVEQEIEQLQEWYEPAVPVISKAFSKDERGKLQKLVGEVWPNELLGLGRDPVLCHGDLHFSNIMYGSDGSLGIIDFGDVGYYDRSKDFIDLDDDKIFAAVSNTYGIGKELKQKIALRQKAWQIITLTFYIRKQDEQGTRRTLAKIKSAIA